MRQPISSNTIQVSGRRIFICLFFLLYVLKADSQTYEDTTVVVAPVVDTTYSSDDYVADDEEGDFLQRGQSDSFRVNARSLPKGYADSLKKDNDFWYADTDHKKKEKKKKKQEQGSYIPVGERSWFQFLLWMVIIGGFAGAIMWYLVESNVSFFRKKDTSLNKDTGPDEIPEDIFAINYQREIDKAVAQGNYRLAVRLMYLRLLKNMSDKELIQYKQDRTNFDYLLQLQSTGYYPSFFRLTRHYEYSWYGHFDVGDSAYKVIANEFNQFDKQMR